MILPRRDVTRQNHLYPLFLFLPKSHRGPARVVKSHRMLPPRPLPGSRHHQRTSRLLELRQPRPHPEPVAVVVFRARLESQLAHRPAKPGHRPGSITGRARSPFVLISRTMAKASSNSTAPLSSTSNCESGFVHVDTAAPKSTLLTVEFTSTC